MTSRGLKGGAPLVKVTDHYEGAQPPKKLLSPLLVKVY